jgi:hypothetical protein
LKRLRWNEADVSGTGVFAPSGGSDTLLRHGAGFFEQHFRAACFKPETALKHMGGFLAEGSQRFMSVTLARQPT